LEQNEIHAAQIIVDLKVRNTDKVFDYIVPPELRAQMRVGLRVLVPFGTRTLEGYVVRYPVVSATSGLKPIISILDPEPFVTERELQVAEWMRDEYLCLFAHAVQCWLPPGTALRSSSQAVKMWQEEYRLLPGARAELDALKRAPRQREAVQMMLAQDGKATAGELRAAGFSTAVLEGLMQKGLAVKEKVRIKRDPWRHQSFTRTDHSLTPDQAVAVARITAALDSRGRFLLHGVTGSGKTLVYLHVIRAAIERGYSAIVLVPEISLTPQAVAEFKGWFGDRVAVLHSRLSISERADQWHAAADGGVQVVLGARSAVFAPLRNLGLIIIDEEQENAYKQEETPRYHTRDVAARRLSKNGVLVLGSATPSIESYTAAQQQQFELLRLPHRVDNSPLPPVEVVDMREELLAGNRSIFSRKLQLELHNCLTHGEQAVLFLNRRGFASFVLCRECGTAMGCRSCQVSLTFHEPNTLACHYCGARRALPQRCPTCGGVYLRPFGAGTQRVEQEVRKLYPRARVLRMDVDTTARKGAHEAIWQAFLHRQADILVGTQMVAKGLHFPGVTLVGVVSADTSLHFPDFRAAERTFQLLTQVAGRAGRGEKDGRVVIQTYTPDHYAVITAKEQNYEAFYEVEREFRKRANYPPFGSLARLLLTADDEEELARIAGRVGLACQGTGAEVVGPAPAPLSRLKDRYRWHILLKGEQRAVLAAAKAGIAAAGRSCRIIADVNPYSLL
jgi:primosomal protein N' (replication factor Y)